MSDTLPCEAHHPQDHVASHHLSSALAEKKRTHGSRKDSKAHALKKLSQDACTWQNDQVRPVRPECFQQQSVHRTAYARHGWLLLIQINAN